MQVSVITTVKNEGEAIRLLLDSLLQQVRLPDEVVVADGGSTDQTLEVLSEYERWLPLKIVLAPGSNISTGRNRAIAAAAGPIIAATDAGVVLSPFWLEELVRPIEKDGVPVVAGWFEPDPYTDFEVALGATVLPSLADVDPARFLPSSRSVAFLKEAWEAAGRYPEWLDYSEDLVFDLALRERYGAFAFAPRAVAFFRPRQNLRAFFRQYYHYGRGDGRANLWPKRHAIRYATYLVLLPLLLREIWYGRMRGWLGLAAGAAAYSYRPARRLWPATWRWRPPSRLRAFALIPIIRFTGDVAKMLGYAAGTWWRWQHR